MHGRMSAGMFIGNVDHTLTEPLCVNYTNPHARQEHELKELRTHRNTLCSDRSAATDRATFALPGEKDPCLVHPFLGETRKINTKTRTTHPSVHLTGFRINTHVHTDTESATMVMNGPKPGMEAEKRGADSDSLRTSPERGTPAYPLFPRVMSALFYAVCAIFIVIVNKLVLTSYRFPSFVVLGLGQLVITVVLLSILRLAGVIHFPSPHRHIFKQVWPLPLLFLCSIVFSLGGSKKLSIPMYVVLRRFGNLFIMLAEYLILGHAASWFVQLTVYLMIFGAFIAALDDLAFDLHGYAFVLVTNVVAALNGVITKQKLNNNALGTYGLMFYNSVFMVLPATALAFFTGDIRKAWDFNDWSKPDFLLLFVLACVMGFLITFSTMLSTQYNSALTTSIVGVLKNVIVVYSGMIIGGDYIYSFLNFVGINVSMVGGFMYSYATFISKSRGSASGGVTNV